MKVSSSPRLPDPMDPESFFAADQPMVVQLVNSAGGCWQSAFFSRE